MGIFKRLGLKKSICILLLLFLAGTVTFALRGPYTSNFLKKVIQRQLQTATGNQVIAQKMYINIFPFFIGVTDIKMFNEQGKRLFSADTIKSYIGLSGILRGEFEISRLYIGTAQVSTTRADAEDVLKNLKSYANRKRIVKVRVKTVEIKDSGFSFYDEANLLTASGKGVNADINIREAPDVSFSASELSGTFKNWPEIKAEANGNAILRKDGVDLKALKITSYGSLMNSTGFYTDETGSFSVTLNVLVDSIKKIFGLKRRGEGRIYANGTIKLQKDITMPFVDMALKGDFYLETLMELLRAKKPKKPLDGLISFRGNLTGNINDIKGNADARLKKGTLFGVKVDDLKCSVSYEDGSMKFKNGIARLYNGKGTLEASMSIPKGKPYSVMVRVRDVDSPPLIELIKVSRLRLPSGKVTGELYSSGYAFNPKGRFSFVSVETLNHPLGRIKYADGSFQMTDRVLSLSEISIKTAESDALISGTLNLNSKTIEMSGTGITSDVFDLMSPYFKRLTGQAEIGGKVTGTFDDPLVEMDVISSGARLDDYAIGNVVSSFSYRKSLLEIRQLIGLGEGGEISAKGKVMFPSALKVFDLKEPDYDLSVSVQKADLGGLIKVLKTDIPSKGSLSSDLTIKGTAPLISGSAQLKDVELYDIPISTASFRYCYDLNDFNVDNAIFRQAESSLSLKGRFSRNKDFSFTASSTRLHLKDLLRKPIIVNYALNFLMEGRGSFDNPQVSLKGWLSEGIFKGKAIGDGILKAELKGRDVFLDAKVLDGMLGIKANATLAEELPWSAEVDIGSGRYDFLLFSFLRDVPADSALTMKGSVYLKGTKNHIEADAGLSYLNVAMFGQEIINDSEVRLKVFDRKVSLLKTVMRSGDASFSIAGAVEVGRNYDISIEGKSPLSILKGVSDRISILRGTSDFMLTLEGDWENPVINGSLSVSDGTVALKGIPQHLTAINAYLTVEGRRIVFQRAHARFGGGEIGLKGMISLSGFEIERLYLDTEIKDITASISKDFSVNLGGNLVLKGTAQSQDITGELTINRARYRESFEWKSWLISSKKTKQAGKPSPYLDRMNLSVRVSGSDNITVDNNIARASLKVDMVLKGTVGSPLLFGRIEAKDGRVYFRNSEFQILTATADYAEHLRAGPFFGIIAETFSKGYHIRLSLEGQVDRFHMSLYSDPPLGEIEILSLLTVGDFGENLKGLEGSIGAAEAASFLTGKYQDVIEERLKDITGIDRATIDPYISKSSGSIVPRVTVTKKLLGERLFATYSTAVGAQEQVLKLEYFLAGNVSLVGLRDERGSVGGDIKFRFQFK